VNLLILVWLCYQPFIDKLPIMINSKLDKIVEEVAEKHNLNPRLVRAVISAESGGYIFQTRVEPGFYRKYIKGKTLKELPGKNPVGVDEEIEKEARSTSFGVMQLMLQTARENGFEGHAVELFDLRTNINIGCKLLAKLLNKKKGVVREALLAYNGGGDLKYPDKVFKFL